MNKSFPWLDSNSQQAKDLERFRWFSSGYLAISKNHPSRIIDIRYSILPNDINSLWGRIKNIFNISCLICILI